LFFLISTVVIGVLYVTSVIPKNVSILSRTLICLSVVFPLLSYASILWGIAVILDMRLEIKNRCQLQPQYLLLSAFCRGDAF